MWKTIDGMQSTTWDSIFDGITRQNEGLKSRERDFPGGSEVKNPPPNGGDKCLIPRWKDPLEKEMTTHSSALAREISWTEEPGGLQSMGCKRVG